MLGEMPGRSLAIKLTDESHVVFGGRVSTLKILVENRSEKIFREIYLSPPPEYRDERKVMGVYRDFEVTWGGGVRKGALLMLKNDETTLRPGEKGVIYMLAIARAKENVGLKLPLEVYCDSSKVEDAELRVEVKCHNILAFIYRPRYVPRINKSLQPLVEKVLKTEGLPEVDTMIWPVNISEEIIRPRLQVYFNDNLVAKITGDIGTGIVHISDITVHRDIYIGLAPHPVTGEKRWYWVLRLWFFWLDPSIFDEVPDAERVELWINPATERVDWVITDRHWREVAYKGPVDYAKVRITAGSSIFRGRISSYHPPVVQNMEKHLTSQDSRDPNVRPLTIEQAIFEKLDSEKLEEL